MSTPRVPVCEVAATITVFKDRLKHYRQCSDPRCQARVAAFSTLAKAFAEDQKRQAALRNK